MKLWLSNWLRIASLGLSALFGFSILVFPWWISIILASASLLVDFLAFRNLTAEL